MKKLYFGLRLTLLAVFSLFIAGCATTQQSASNVRRFNEARSASVVLRFSSWDYTFLVQPFYCDNGGFLQQLKHDDIRPTVQRLNVSHDMAVVTVGWNYQDEVLDKVVSDWKSILDGCGFRRIVFLRATADQSLNGAVVIEDSQQQFASAAPRTAALY